MSPEIPPQPNTPAGQDHPTPEEKGQSATVDALANAAGRGPSAEAMEFTREFFDSKRTAPIGRKIARLLDAYAARRVEQAVAQERERCLKIMHAYGIKYTLPGAGAIEDINSGITTRGRPKP